MKKANLAYKILLALAAPFILWTSFEMYFLTLFGPQMLFFSIIHAYPNIVLMNSLSAPFYLLLAIYIGVLLILARFKSIHVLPTNILGTVLAFQLLHVLALVTYQQWAFSWFRLPVCLIALALLIKIVIMHLGGWQHVKAYFADSK